MSSTSEHRRHTAGAEALERRRLLSAVATPAVAEMRAYPAHSIVGRAGPAGTGVVVASPAFNAGSNGPTGFAPADVRGAYGLDAVTFDGVTGDGSGQTIAVVVAYDDPAFVSSSDASGFAASDLHQFDAQFGIPDPPAFTKVNQTGSQTGLPGTDPTGGWEDETALDVEWAHAAAPAAKILLVECNSDGLDDLIDGGVNYARQQPGVSVVSMSFAAPEAASETSYDMVLTTPAGHAGVTFVAAAGDSGTPAEYPAASPTVVGVGGTTATLDGNLYGGETGLSNGGGGASQYEPKPLYQFGLPQSTTNRLTPDVAFEANHDTNGNDVYDSYNGGAADPWYSVGGTSIAAPIWAGIIAMADQGRARLGLGSMDGASQTLPRLYLLDQSDFHDVTTGNNGSPAGVGYDLVTGRGTPIANLLVPDLAGGASIAGYAYSDANGNATRDPGEPGLGDVTVYLDVYHTGVGEGIDAEFQTLPTGRWDIADLPGGTYRVTSVPLPGYAVTTPAYYTVTVSYGSAATGKDVAEQRGTGTVSGHVFEDLNLSRTFTSGDPTYGGGFVYLDTNDDGTYDAGDTRATVDSSGYYEFAGLPEAATYHVRQDIPAGFSRTTLGYGDAADVTLDSSTYTLDIGYVPNAASLSGTVFADANGNGTQDAGEAGIAGTTVYLDLNSDGTYTPGVDVPVTTDANGRWTITGLAPRNYIVNEVLPGGYRRVGSAAGTVVTVGVAATVTGANFADQAT